MGETSTNEPADDGGAALPHSLGRPRDPRLDERVFEGTCRLYGQVGWAGLSIEAVARNSSVGKASIYLRWPDKSALLGAALKSQLSLPEDLDTGSVRSDLERLAILSLSFMQGEFGNAVIRLAADARVVPELAEQWQDFAGGHVRMIREIAQRGVTRGELPSRTRVIPMLDALFGGLMMHSIISPFADDRPTVESSHAYALALVDMVLGSVRGAAQLGADD